MRNTLLLFFLTNLILLSGCSSDTGKVLALSEVSSAGTYVFDDEGIFYLLEDNVATPIQKHPEELCALVVQPVKGDFNLRYVLPGKYTAPLTDVFAYVTRLQLDGYVLTPKYLKSHISEYELISTDTRIRIIITDDAFVRIYALSSDNVNTYPPYINEDTLDINGSSF